MEYLGFLFNPNKTQPIPVNSHRKPGKKKFQQAQTCCQHSTSRERRELVNPGHKSTDLSRASVATAKPMLVRFAIRDWVHGQAVDM